MWDKTQGTEFFDGLYNQSKDDFPDLWSWETTCGDKKKAARRVAVISNRAGKPVIAR